MASDSINITRSIRQMKTANNELQCNLHEKQRQKSELESTFNKLRLKLQQLDETKSLLTDALGVSRAKLNDSQAESDSLHQNLLTLKAEHDRLETELTRMSCVRAEVYSDFEKRLQGLCVKFRAAQRENTPQQAEEECKKLSRIIEFGVPEDVPNDEQICHLQNQLDKLSTEQLNYDISPDTQRQIMDATVDITDAYVEENKKLSARLEPLQAELLLLQQAAVNFDATTMETEKAKIGQQVVPA